MINSVVLLESLDQITNSNTSYIQNKISNLSDTQLTWAPNNSSWSINQVLAHLNAYSKFYNAEILDKIVNTKHTTPREIFVSSPLGKSAWSSMKLGRANNVKRKFNAPKAYNPVLATEIMEGNQVELFIKGQQELKEILVKAGLVDLKKVKVQISLSKFIRFRLGDILMFVIYHNERHIQQIKNLINHRAFPKK